MLIIYYKYYVIINKYIDTNVCMCFCVGVRLCADTRITLDFHQNSLLPNTFQTIYNNISILRNEKDTFQVRTKY